ncbi:type II TA system antitoxin MqsA family protein [Pseudoduganella umbonata]|uniref:HTH-type transcriptional regulator/antitoxin MqsA n=1 Tax=Pseudoduganella umbonata TaxID=864828 RepID=A0A4P8HQI9_9BURK|nr:type II TA system antitoxin MqsA family protein [Pseudoduganella umbonata]MBB3220427.1 HTH-type transcriptional regulator/antitoxin MqsA [Pseudoduganella umbonata]QCP12043.1 YgiT-type zinc finger protein [Pseudoduganella umbonata]
MEKCPDCGAPDPVHDTHGVSYTYKDRHTTIPSVSGYHCVQCGGVALDGAAVERFDELVARFHRRVDGELADPAYIAAVRRRLRLDPSEADDLFGTDTGAFASYEAGKATPHPSTIKLLQLLERHPELLDELHG